MKNPVENCISRSDLIDIIDNLIFLLAMGILDNDQCTSYLHYAIDIFMNRKDKKHE